MGQWTEASENVQEVQCLQLSSILTPLEIPHINFFLLDVEGAELDILKTIDFGPTKFDVVMVETDRGVDTEQVTKEYVDSVIELLAGKGYVVWKRKEGMKCWFIRSGFKPYLKVEL